MRRIVSPRKWPIHYRPDQVTTLSGKIPLRPMCHARDQTEYQQVPPAQVAKADRAPIEIESKRNRAL